ncbi:MAG: ethanolamine ammonia-lyase reactivating factor EutA, partial [Gorillibacterium sp.]|nr:ethanolamine ammonia-lyase reactivating factor EutA [Gorillibacterium sp.]
MSRDDQWVTSIGIDLGTGTTKLIVSKLRISRLSNDYSLPDYAIAERNLIYCGGMHPTPLIDEETIDVERIAAILDLEYGRAGIQFADIDTGAVIITGETANKANARQILHQLADRSGDFVVATAGPDLEGMLAGKGSGAEARSLELAGTVVNIDIGAGTANAAFFRGGRCECTVTLRIGGKSIRFDAKGTIQ